jgi:hypothetical protein
MSDMEGTKNSGGFIRIVKTLRIFKVSLSLSPSLSLPHADPQRDAAYPLPCQVPGGPGWLASWPRIV